MAKKMSETYLEFRQQKFVEKLKSRFLEVIDNAERVESMKIETEISRNEVPMIRYEITELIVPDADFEDGDGDADE